MGMAMCMVALMAACTDLTEPVDSQVTAENFFQTDQQFVSALGDAYSTLTNLGGGGAPGHRFKPSLLAGESLLGLDGC